MGTAAGITERARSFRTRDLTVRCSKRVISRWLIEAIRPRSARKAAGPCDRYDVMMSRLQTHRRNGLRPEQASVPGQYSQRNPRHRYLTSRDRGAESKRQG